LATAAVAVAAAAA
jgi:hypothetical protein